MNELSLVLNFSSTQPDFDTLFLAYFNQVISYLERLVGDIGVAHRLSEETFSELARYYRKGKTPNEPRSLMYLVATARAREYLKKGDKQSFWQRTFGHAAEPTVEFLEDHVAGLTNGTEQRALSTLEFNSRVVLLLHDYCDLSYDQVARAAAVGRSSVPRDLDRARHAFQQAYDYIKF
ncbi:MAG: RNA polymerase sigma factor [Candidatus Dormibacteraeota bacterium]|nr:RNA polymerase sigma factor [Candidatus Dormibacteraeota bacterium]